MSFQKYPVEIKGNRISNLILVENYEWDDKKNNWLEERDSLISQLHILKK